MRSYFQLEIAEEDGRLPLKRGPKALTRKRNSILSFNEKRGFGGTGNKWN